LKCLRGLKRWWMKQELDFWLLCLLQICTMKDGKYFTYGFINFFPSLPYFPFSPDDTLEVQSHVVLSFSWDFINFSPHS
jgi:hypothetical protein